MKTTYELTREFAVELEGKVRESYVSAGFVFEATPEKETDVTISIMDCNEQLSNLDYPCHVKQIAKNIDGSITFECIVDEEESE